MKKLMVLTLMVSMVLSSVFAQGGAEATSGAKWASKVEVYVPAKAGGGTDVMARALATQVAKDSGNTLTIMNNTDGSGVVAMETVRTAKPDGSKILQFHTTMLIKTATGLYNKKVAEDFTIIGVSRNPGAGGYVLVAGPNAPFNSARELAEYSKQKQLLMGVETGGTVHLITGMYALASGANVKYVEAGTDTEKLTTLVGGNIDACFVNVNQARQYVEAGKVKALGLVSSTREPLRNPVLPEVPTLVEDGYDVFFSFVNLFLGPKGMDPALVAEIYDYYAKAAANDDVNAILAPASMNMTFYPQAESLAIVQEQQVMLDKVVAQLGLQVK